MNHRGSFAVIVSLLISLCAFAQEIEDRDTNVWTVFDMGTGTSHEVDLNEVQVAAAEMVPLAIVNGDDREEITGRADSVGRAVVALEMKVDDQHGAACSGSLVGPNVVLTASHCVVQKGNYVKEVNVFIPGISSSGGSDNGNPSKDQPKKEQPKQGKGPFVPPCRTKGCSIEDMFRLIQTGVGKQTQTTSNQFTQHANNAGWPRSRRRDNPSKMLSAKAAKLIANTKYIELDKKNLPSIDPQIPFDFAIIVLDKPIGNQVGWLEVSAEKTSALKGLPIVEIGRPGDKAKRTLWRGEGTIGVVDRYSFLHNADQMPGNSGGTIFSKQTMKIIGLSNFGPADERPVKSGYPNGGMRITDAVIKAVQNWR